MKIIEPKLSPTALKIAQKRYLRTDMNGKVVETPGEMFWRVAEHMAKAEVKWPASPSQGGGVNGIVQETAEKFYQRMVNWKFVCAGKAMFEAGNHGGTGQLSSCFVLPVRDEISSIFKTLGDAAVVHKNNGGTGFNFSHIRSRGDKVKNVPGAASGPVDFLAAYSAALSKILQGAKRQGANIGILNADHPDIIDFIVLKDEDGTIKNFNLSVGVTDEFMKAVSGDKFWHLINPRTNESVRKIKARKLFQMIVEHAWANGDPGLFFLTTANRDNPTPAIGQIEATNPCITGDMLISTENGLITFADLYNKYRRGVCLGLLTDHKTINESGTHVHRSGAIYRQGEKNVFQLITKSGFQIKTTADHKIFTLNGWKKLKDLTDKDKILIQSQEGKFGSSSKIWNQKLGQLVGYIIGDGFVRLDNKNGGYICISFGNNRQHILNYIRNILENIVGTVTTRFPDKRSTQLWKHSQKYAQWFIKNLGITSAKAADKVIPTPIFTAPKSAVTGFLQGLFSSDGTINFIPGKSSYIRLSSKSLKLLQQTQLLLINLGIISRIYNRSRKARTDLFPVYQDRYGENKRYGSDGILWELEISKSSVPVFLDKIGFLAELHQEKIKKLQAKTYYQSRFYDSVLSIKSVGKEMVYDLTEPVTHSFIANGIVVSNCGEIPLLPYESCNLLSICLQNHLQKNKIDWDDLEQSIRLGVRFLDDMIEVNTYPLSEIENMVKNGNRRIGLGVMGFAHILIKLRIPYNSSQAVKLAERLSKFIREKAENESRRLAAVRGNFGNWDISIYADLHPMRNCATTMIAPTGTISMLADTTSGIEPIFSLVTKRKTFFEGDKKNRPTKELYMVDSVFEEELERYLKSLREPPKAARGNLASDSHVASLLGMTKRDILNQVSEHGLDSVKGFPEWFYQVFVTTHDISWQYHVRIQSAWQKYFDNSISKTINFPHTATVADVEKAYMLAWKLDCKGITIYRDGSKQDQVLNTTQTHEEHVHVEPAKPATGPSDICPNCGAVIIFENGCSTCHSCGWSKCSL